MSEQAELVRKLLREVDGDDDSVPVDSELNFFKKPFVENEEESQKKRSAGTDGDIEMGGDS